MAQHRLNYHHLISQSTVSAAGPPLVNAVVDAQSQLYWLPGFRRAYARVRLLSVLGLPTAAPAAVLPVLVANVVAKGSFRQSRGSSLPRVARLGPNYCAPAGEWIVARAWLR
jgi:hypothetical protein